MRQSSRAGSHPAPVLHSSRDLRGGRVLAHALVVERAELPAEPSAASGERGHEQVDDEDGDADPAAADREPARRRRLGAREHPLPGPDRAGRLRAKPHERVLPGAFRRQTPRASPGAAPSASGLAAPSRSRGGRARRVPRPTRPRCGRRGRGRRRRGPKRVRSVVSSPRRARGGPAPEARSARTAVPLSAATDGRTSSTFRPQRGSSPSCAGALGDLLELGARRILVLGPAVVVGERKPLVLDRERDGVPESSRSAAASSAGPLVQLEAVVAHVADPVQADERSRLLARAAADAGDEQVGAGEARELDAGLGRDAGEPGPRRDRRKRAVDVEEERRLLGRLAERGQRDPPH